jgi:hypothetical protein
MSDNKTKLSYEDRIKACKLLAADLREAQINAEAWDAYVKGKPGTGVSVFDDRGFKIAALTVSGGGFINLKKVRTDAVGTPLLDRVMELTKTQLGGQFPAEQEESLETGSRFDLGRLK